MKIIKSVTIIFLLLVQGCVQQQSPREVVYDQFLDDLNIVINRNEQFLGLVRSKADRATMQFEFRKLRLQYKRIEAFAEYFTPSTVKLVNGAPLDEVEDEENAVFEPGGLQVIEELLFTDEKTDLPELVRHVRKLQVNLKRIKMLWADMAFDDSHVMDALRLELFRVITLGISGFDTPGSGNALAEGAVVLRAFQDYISAYSDVLPAAGSLSKQAGKAIIFLEKGETFNDFDRAAFITRYLNPLCRALHAAQQKAGIPFVRDRRLLRGDAVTLFDKNAFDAEALVANPRFRSNAARVELGRRLFYEVKLSGNARTSCGSCHQPAAAYTDGMKTSQGIAGAPVRRNAPTVMYAALQQAMFYDLRSPSLEDQASDVIHNTEEMRGSLQKITTMITGDASYRDAFREAYADTGAIRPAQVQNALASFIRSLGTFDAPFDRYMRGDAAALTDEQVQGFNLFMGKARCGTCHFIPLFNGTVPPDYQRSESEVLGVTAGADLKHPSLDPDRGRGAFNHFPQWQHAFKTSTLRNVAQTAPYMHNGAYATLQEVMDFYNEGGGGGLGLDVPNQTLATDKLGLTKNEIAQVIAFMESLTDSKF